MIDPSLSCLMIDVKVGEVVVEIHGACTQITACTDVDGSRNELKSDYLKESRAL